MQNLLTHQLICSLIYFFSPSFILPTYWLVCRLIFCLCSMSFVIYNKDFFISITINSPEDGKTCEWALGAEWGLLGCAQVWVTETSTRKKQCVALMAAFLVFWHCFPLRSSSLLFRPHCLLKPALHQPL